MPKKEKAKFALEYVDNPQVAVFKKLNELEDKFSLQKGDRGEKGERGLKGEKGDKGDRGDKGEQGIQGERGEQGLKGKMGIDGKDGSPDNPQQIADKLNTLNEKVEIKVIKDLEKRLNEKQKETIKEIPKSKTVERYIQRVAGGGGASYFTQLNDTPSEYTGEANKLVSVKNDESGVEFSTGETILDPIYVRRDGTLPLTGNWNAGNFKITAGEFHLDDNKKATFGNGNDLEIYSDGDNGIIRQLTEDKDIKVYLNVDGVDTQVMRFRGADGDIIISENDVSAPHILLQANVGGSGIASSTLTSEGAVARYSMNAYGSFGNLNARRLNGTIASPTAVTNNNVLMRFGGGGYDGSVITGNTAQLEMRATENWNATSWGTKMSIDVTPNGTTSRIKAITLENNGYIGIGETSPQAELHTTKGRIVNVDRYTTTTTLNADNHQVFGDTDGGAFTINLPAGVEGTYYRIVNTGSSGNNLTITPNGSEKLLGSASSFNLADGESLIIVYHPTEGWF